MGALFSCKLNQCDMMQWYPHKMVAVTLSVKLRTITDCTILHFSHSTNKKKTSSRKYRVNSQDVSSSLLTTGWCFSVWGWMHTPYVSSDYDGGFALFFQAYGMSVLPLNLIKGTRSVAYERLENTEDTEDVEHQIEKLKSKVGFERMWQCTCPRFWDVRPVFEQ